MSEDMLIGMVIGAACIIMGFFIADLMHKNED